ncbi:MAG TPA: molecular chaperone DnaK, partial [Myxococcales bacterium]|nr:molecular chaperone DnaK [Myxococcales bacterium]
WRRVAAGLNRAHHEEIHRRLAPLLLPARGAAAAKKLPRPQPEAHELAEIWRCAASLERLAANHKEPLGDALVKDLARPSPPGYALWSLGRLGARVPLYGPANTVVPPEKASRWVRALLDRPPATGRESADAVFALVQIGRVSGDRARDLDESVRLRAADRLEKSSAPPEWSVAIREVQALGEKDEQRVFGEALPLGLHLA